MVYRTKHFSKEFDAKDLENLICLLRIKVAY